MIQNGYWRLIRHFNHLSRVTPPISHADCISSENSLGYRRRQAPNYVHYYVLFNVLFNVLFLL